MEKTKELINEILNDVDKQYNSIIRNLESVGMSIQDLHRYANQLLSTDDFSIYSYRLSAESWQKRACEMMRELSTVNKKKYPTTKSILKPIYRKLRDVYGVVFEQLIKDYQYKNNTLRVPTAFEAISDSDEIREIFDSLLIDLFPEKYFVDDIVEGLNNEEDPEENDDESHSVSEEVFKIITPLAIKYNDDSFGYHDTFEKVCNNMNCSWSNLSTRYMNKNNTSEFPSKLTIISNNESVFRKFKKEVSSLLKEYTTNQELE